jgi:hypothetical protein
VDIEKTFLGASPDGNRKKKIYLEMNPRDDDKILLKENDNYMYQVQGQPLMSNLQKCYFIVHTYKIYL